MLYLKPDTLLVLDPNALMKHGHTAPSGQHKSACAAIVAPPARGPRWHDGLFAYLCAPVQKTWRYADACVLLFKFAVKGPVFSCKSSCACTTGGFPGRTYRLTPPAAPPCLAAALRVEIKDFSCFYAEQTDPMFSNTSKTTHDYTDSECQDGAVTLWHNGSVLTKWLFWLYLPEGVLRKNTVDSDRFRFSKFCQQNAFIASSVLTTWSARPSREKEEVVTCQESLMGWEGLGVIRIHGDDAHLVLIAIWFFLILALNICFIYLYVRSCLYLLYIHSIQHTFR